MAKILGYITSIFGAAGSVVTTAAPVVPANGLSFSALGLGLIQLAQTYGPTLLPLIPPPYGPAIVALVPLVTKLLAIATTLFAVAHVTTPAAPSTPTA
jgi:hypothetical protein